MKRSPFTDEQILAIVKKGEAGRKVADLGEAVVDNSAVRQLLTITGVNAIVAIGLWAAIGDIARFRSPEKLVSYFGLNPSVYQSGLTGPLRTATRIM